MQVIPQFFVLLTFAFLMSNSQAHDDKTSMRKVFKTCFQESGIERGQKPSKEEKQKLEACLLKNGMTKEQLAVMKEKRKAFKKARRACAEETGIERPKRGEKLNEEDRKKIHACLKEKGIEKPKKKFNSLIRSGFHPDRG